MISFNDNTFAFTSRYAGTDITITTGYDPQKLVIGPARDPLIATDVATKNYVDLAIATVSGTSTTNTVVATSVIIVGTQGSTSASNGSLIVTGGSGFQGTSYFGSNVNINGNLSVTGNSSFGAGTFGTLNVGFNSVIGGSLKVSGSSTLGSLNVTGISIFSGAGTFGSLSATGASITNIINTTGTIGSLNTTNEIATNITSTNLNVTGSTVVASLNATSETIGSLNVTGTSRFAQTATILNINSLGNTNLTNVIATSASATGLAVNNANVVNFINLNGNITGLTSQNITVTGTLPTTNVSTGSLVVSGGIGADSITTNKPHYYLVRANTNQNIANNTQTEVIGYFSGGATYSSSSIITMPTNGRFQVSVTGLYLYSSTLSWAADSTGFRQGWTTINGSNNLSDRSGFYSAATTTSGMTTNIHTPIFMTAGDFVSSIVAQNSGGVLALNASPACVTALVKLA